MVDLVALRAEFPPEDIEWRVGATTGDKKSGLALAYIDARHVMDRLDAVCGPEGWKNGYPHAGAKTVCELLIKINDEWIGKADGAGDTDVEATKGALSDAFKRSAVRWGIGRYLYEAKFKNIWVGLKPKGNSFVIDPSETPKLIAILGGAKTQAPKKEMVGPIKPMTALEGKFKNLCAIVREQVELDSFIALKEQANFKELVKQLKVDAPNLWDMEEDGDGGAGLKQLLTKTENKLDKEDLNK